MQAPFLELAFYVGVDKVAGTLNSIDTTRIMHGEASSARIIGLSNRDEEVRPIHGSIVVRTEGEDFCGVRRHNTYRLEESGRRVYEAFIQVAESIECLYGAILVEYSLESPDELRHDPRSLAFRNFYLSRSRLPTTLISRLLAFVPHEAYVRELDHGVYVSMSREFNLLGRGIASELAQNISTQIGHAIGQELSGT